ncbi:hypothetical protein [Amycolatopsis sp. CA-230715]|uniref:hypothetical protein n=1 Tax=Amycolatopsis sp. CA-230715 TaxID=2745196 RepID=UPI001C034FE1|nr:hypothetical protein [Amycolatopsis sp. CA-230715]QWF81131.1 hypothetical protein HUW46_04557 [Amycolatopsis sp. CA-230715]
MITATYADDLARVRLALTGAPADADYATVERSTDGINWATVRGGATVPLSAGNGNLDDYEFAAGVPNQYRVSYVDTALPSFVGNGTPSTADNAPVSPALPASTLLDGDLLLLLATIRNPAAGTAVAPTGWTTVTTYGNLFVFACRYTPGLTAPTVTFTGGSAGDITTGQIAAFRNTGSVLSGVGQASGAGAGIGYPPFYCGPDARLAVILAWKQATVTGDTPPIVTGRVLAVSSALGGGASAFGYTQNVAGNTSYNTGTIALSSDATAISRSLVLTYGQLPYLTRESTSITPAPSTVWLKNPSRPAVNTPVTVTDWSDITRPARTAVHEVVGRTMPVAVTDVQGSRRFTLTITTGDLAAAGDMDSRLATGDVLFLQPPGPDCPVPGPLYAVVGDISMSRHSKRARRRFFDLPLTEVAAPGPTVLGDTLLWADVPKNYATWADVQAAVSTWANLQQKLVPGEVIVP